MTLPLRAVADGSVAAAPQHAAGESTRSGTRLWLGRGVVAFCEQGLLAGGNFVLTFTLSTSLRASDFGAFVFGYTMFTIAAGLHNALILEPATVLRTTLYESHPRRYCRTQVLLHFGAVGVLSGAIALIGVVLLTTGLQPAIGGSLLGAAGAAPFVLLYWLARRFMYVRQQPADALRGTSLYFTGLAGLSLAGRFSGHLSTAGGFAILATGSGAAAVFMLARIGVFTRSSGDPAPFSTKELARERWQYGRWLVGAVCIESTIAPGLTLMTTVLLGLGPIGILRAMQIFAVPAGQAVAAIGALALPALSRDYNRGNMIGFRFKAGRLLAAAVGGAVLFELALVILQQPLETLAYGGRFAPYAPLIPLVGAAALLEGTAATYAMVLSAMQQPRLYLASVAATAPVTLIAGYVCISLWGITGAAIAAMVTALVSVSLRRRLARPLLKRAAPLLRS